MIISFFSSLFKNENCEKDSDSKKNRHVLFFGREEFQKKKNTIEVIGVLAFFDFFSLRGVVSVSKDSEDESESISKISS
jgi:hypothetical protein